MGEPARKKSRLDDRLTISSKYKEDMGHISLADVVKLCPELTLQQYQWVEVRACFQKLHPQFCELQLRLLNLQREEIAQHRAWLSKYGTTEHDKKTIKMTPKQLGAFARTMKDLREAASAAENWPTCKAASLFEARAICCLITCDAQTTGALAGNLNEPEKRLEAVLHQIDELREKLANERLQEPATIPAQPLIRAASSNKSVSQCSPLASSSTMKAVPDPPTSLSSDDYLHQRVREYRVALNSVTVLPWDQVVGCDGLKEDLEVDAFAAQNRLCYKNKVSTQPEGVLLYGPNGTGKTTLVYSFAQHFGLPMYKVSGLVKGNLQGDTERTLQLVFKKVQDEQPCVVFFDEADGLLRAPSSADSSIASYLATIKELWSELMMREDSVFVFGATNNPWDIPTDGFARRFPRQQHIGLPSETDRNKLLEKIIPAWYNVVPEQIVHLAKTSQGYTGDDFRRMLKRVDKALDRQILRAEAWTLDVVVGKKWMSPKPRADHEQPLKYGDLSEAEKVMVRPDRTAAVANMLAQLTPGTADTLPKTVSDEVAKKLQEWTR